MVGLAAFAVPQALAAPTTSCAGTSCTVTFTYTGAPETWTIPAGVSSLTVGLFGAQGGGRQNAGVGVQVARRSVASARI